MDDRTPELQALAERLQRSMAESDWASLRAADAELAQLLARGGRPWSARERAALVQVSQAHEQALQHCRTQASRVEQQLQSLCERKEGWIAYALLSSEWREDLI